MRRSINIFIMALGAMLTLSCHHDITTDFSGENPPREGFVRIDFETRCPDMTEVATRSVDPDGVGVQDLTLFCFDAYGIFLTTVKATITPDEPQPSVRGTFSAEVPDITRRIHFLANQNMSYVDESKFRNLTEAATMAAMEGSSGKIIYWGRFACDDNDSRPVNKQLEEYVSTNGEILLYRNHARISIADWNTEWLEVTGFVTYNAPAFGTVAPYHSTEGFVWPGTTPFVTLPENDAVMSEILDVDTDARDYVFESENRVEGPVSVIIRGRVPGSEEELYYRVMLVDENGEQLLIRRNHHYIINIAGRLSFGKKSFAEAVNAAATNNVWLSISDEINEVADNEFRLAVDETSVVLDESYAGSGYVLKYTLSSVNGVALTDSDKPSVSWANGNTVASNHIVHSFDPSTGRGELTVQILPMTAKDMQQGSIIIKKGRLQRKVKVIVIKTQKFTPSWIGTQIYGETTGQKVTLKFTIPDSCPAELFPFNVYISAQSLDIRAASGMQLSVIDSNSPEFGINRGSHYKYIYTVTEPGPHRLYFENVQTAEDGVEHNLVLEAKYFEHITKTYTFTSSQEAITLTNMRSHSAGANDEPVLYSIVAPKRGATVRIDMALQDKSNGDAVPASEKDEFILFTKSLDYYPDSEASMLGISAFDCQFFPISEDIWSASTDGRAMLFMPYNPTNPAQGTGRFSIYMKTRYANSTDIVRISSNSKSNQSLLPSNNGKNYDGKRYRSTIFDLFTYLPYRFAAQVNGEGSYVTSGDAEESVDAIQWRYGKGVPVTIELDVTSYKNTKAYYEESVLGTSVDPFGEAFDIYIYAPMLEIDRGRAEELGLSESKFRANPEVEGGFIYTVESSREAERMFGTKRALIDDTSNANPSQEGERKELPFKTKRVVSLGDIEITTNKEQILYYDKRFSVSNASIEGSITYGGSESSQTAIPKDSFVVLQRISDGARVGSFTIDSNGHYLLRLRNEYEINWDLDEYTVLYTATDSKVYSTQNIITLPNLMANTNIRLILSE